MPEVLGSTAVPRPAPSHVLLHGIDTAFMDRCEAVLGRHWPACSVQRAHPGADAPLLKAMPRGTLVLLDRRNELRADSLKLVQARIEGGSRVFEVREAPRKQRDLMPRAEVGTDLIDHNLPWSTPEIDPVVSILVALHEGRSLELACPRPDAEHHSRLTDSKLKGAFIQGIADELKRRGVQRTRREKISAATDELLMNALYSAARSAPRGAAPSADVRWRLEEGVFCLTVADHLGTFRRETFETKLVQFLAQEKVEVTRTQGRSGGVGLFIVLRLADTFRLRVIPGQLTEISVRIPTVPPAAGASHQARNEVIAVFSRNPSAPSKN